VDRRFIPVDLTEDDVELDLLLDGSAGPKQELVAVDQQ
jgi:hypothetical protein